MSNISIVAISVGLPQRWARTGLDILSLLAIFSNQDWIWILIFEKIGSGQDQDICLISATKFPWEWLKMSQIMVVVFSLLWSSYSQKIKMILSLCAALITTQSMIIRVTISQIFSGEVEVVNCSYIAGMQLCLLCWVACVLCRLIVYFMGGQLVFDWARPENLLITRDRLVGNKAINTICLSWVSHMQNTVYHRLWCTDRRLSVTPKPWLPHNNRKTHYNTFAASVELDQGSGTYGSRARCGSFDDGVWLAWYFLSTIVTNETAVIFHLPEYKIVSNTMQHQKSH